MTQITMSDGLTGPMLDITAPEHGVEIMVRDNRVWINVDGVCRLRICRSPRTDLDLEKPHDQG